MKDNALADFIRTRPDRLGLLELAGLLVAWRLDTELDGERSFENFYQGKLSLERLESRIASNQKRSALFMRFANLGSGRGTDEPSLAILVGIAMRDSAVEELEACLSERAMGFRDAFYIPEAVLSLMLGIVADAGARGFYLPFFGDPLALRGARGLRLSIDHPKPQVHFWAEVARRVHGLDLESREGDCIEGLVYTDGAEHLPRRFDAALVFPHFNMRPSFPAYDPAGRFVGLNPRSQPSTETLFIQHALAHAPLVVACVPNGFLFRGRGADTQFRDSLLRKGALRAVVSLPGHIFSNTALAASLLVIDSGHRGEEVLFIDTRIEAGSFRKRGGPPPLDPVREILRGGNAALPVGRASIEEIIETGSVLSIERYMSSDDEGEESESSPLSRLDELAELSRPQILEENDDEGSVAVEEVLFSDLPEAGAIAAGSKAVRARKDDRVLARYRLEPYDILLAARGTIGETIPVGIVAAEPRAILFPSQMLFTIRLRDRAAKPGLAIAIYRYLRSARGQARLRRFLHGTAIPQLSASDMRAFALPVPTPEQLATEKAAFARECGIVAEIATLRAELAGMRNVSVI